MDILFFIFVLLCSLHFIEMLIAVAAISQIKINTKKNQDKTAFTVVICAHNELFNLKRNLPHILSQKYSAFEVIVVLDRCGDGSYDWLEAIFESDERLRVLSINKVPANFNPKKYALTQAITLAKNDWILLTDADCYPDSKLWIESYNQLVSKDTDFIIGTSPYVNNQSFLSSFINYETFQTAKNYIAAAKLGFVYMGVGRNMAYSKNIFIKNNGLNRIKDVVGGDDDLFIQQHATAANTIINIDKDATVLSYPKSSWKTYYNQKTRHLSVGKHYRTTYKTTLAISHAIHTSMWLSFIILVSFKPNHWGIAAIFSLTLIAKGLVSQYSSAKLHMNWSWKSFILTDFMFAVLLPFVGLKSQLIKKVKWN